MLLLPSVMERQKTAIEFFEPPQVILAVEILEILVEPAVLLVWTILYLGSFLLRGLHTRTQFKQDEILETAVMGVTTILEPILALLAPTERQTDTQFLMCQMHP